MQYNKETIKKFEIEIKEGESLSPAIDIFYASHVAIMIPTDWTTADLSIEISDTPDGDYLPLNKDSGITVEAGTYINLGDALFPYRFIKLRSGTNSVPVSQDGDRLLKVLVKG